MAKPMATIYGPYGNVVSGRQRPERQPEAEQQVREKLQQIDSLLDVIWFQHAVYNRRYDDFEGRYALVCNWPIGDPKWQLYQSGEMQTHHDVLGWFCEDIHDANSMPVSVDSIENKVIELLGKCDGRRMPHTKRMAEIVQKNAKLRKQRRESTLDQVEEMAGTMYDLASKHHETTYKRLVAEAVEKIQK